MAVLKYCKNCNAKISIRKMPNGYNIPFDYQTDIVHKCKKQASAKSFSPKEKIVDEAIRNKNDITFYSKDVLVRFRPISRRNRIIKGVDYNRGYDSTFNLDKVTHINLVYSITNKKVGELNKPIFCQIINLDNNKIIGSFLTNLDININNPINSIQLYINYERVIREIYDASYGIVDKDDINKYGIISYEKDLIVPFSYFINNFTIYKLDEEKRIQLNNMKKIQEQKQNEIKNLNYTQDVTGNKDKNRKQNNENKGDTSTILWIVFIIIVIIVYKSFS